MRIFSFAILFNMLNPDKKIYRKEGIKEGVEAVVRKNYENPEVFTEAKLKGFFGLEKNVELTPEEVEEFKRYVAYAGKRLLVHSVALDEENLFSRKEVMKSLRETGKNTKGLALHDVSHTFAAYDFNQGENDSPVVPRFLNKEDREDQYKGMEEELFAFLWWNPVGNRPMFMACLNAKHLSSWVATVKNRFVEKEKHQGTDPFQDVFFEDLERAVADVDHDDFESVLNTYYNIALLLLKINHVNLCLRDGDMNETQIRADLVHFDEQAKKIFENKEERTVALARDVFLNYKNDPKILFHKFQEICAPLLERLNRKGHM